MAEGGEGQNRCGAGNARSRVDRPLYLELRYVPVIIGVSFSSRSTSPSFDIFVWQPYRARPAKKGRAVRCQCFTTANRGARVFSTRMSRLEKCAVASRSSQFPKNRILVTVRKTRREKTSGDDGGDDDRIFRIRRVKAFARSRLLCSTDTFYLSNGNSRVRAIKDSTDLETRELRNVDGEKRDNGTTLFSTSCTLLIFDSSDEKFPLFFRKDYS